MKIRGNTIGTNMKPEKNLVKATDLSPEEQAQARDNIGAASADVIGDIETALDRIIEIQESLINGGGGEENPDATWEICGMCDQEYDSSQGPCPNCYGGDGE